MQDTKAEDELVELGGEGGEEAGEGCEQPAHHARQPGRPPSAQVCHYWLVELVRWWFWYLQSATVRGEAVSETARESGASQPGQETQFRPGTGLTHWLH